MISSGMEINELINVTYAGSEGEGRDRERKSLLNASRGLGSSKLTIITWDYWKEGEINYIPLWYWLLSGNDFEGL